MPGLCHSCGQVRVLVCVYMTLTITGKKNKYMWANTYSLSALESASLFPKRWHMYRKVGLSGHMGS